MINKSKLALIVAVAASIIALPAAAMAQSAYTSGTAASREAAGYPSPYGNGYYAYAPDSDRSAAQDRRQPSRTEIER